MMLQLMHKSSAKAKYHGKLRQSICFKLCQYQIHAPNSRQKKFHKNDIKRNERENELTPK